MYGTGVERLPADSGARPAPALWACLPSPLQPAANLALRRLTVSGSPILPLCDYPYPSLAAKADFECERCSSRPVVILLSVVFFVANIVAALVTVLLTFLADYTEDEELAVGDIIKVRGQGGGGVGQRCLSTHAKLPWVSTQLFGPTTRRTRSWRWGTSSR